MKLAVIQFTSWDKHYYADVAGFEVNPGSYLLVNTDVGLDIGKIIKVTEAKNINGDDKDTVLTIERVATNQDLERLKDNNKGSDKEVEYCKTVVKKHNLEMKVIDCQFSYDDKRVMFAFIADGRVDFRELVKDLTRHFQRVVRLHQLGVRDEAKISGDVGSCGRGLCCKGHLTELTSVTSEFAEQQQVAHRGSERLSGACGRLKCCLAYEKELYEEMGKKLPQIGTRVRTDHGRGEVIGWHTLKSSVDVKLDPEKDGGRPVIVEIEIKK
jgi:cell fate regulator YaaT (PSP1 superfamily)